MEKNEKEEYTEDAAVIGRISLKRSLLYFLFKMAVTLKVSLPIRRHKFSKKTAIELADVLDKWKNSRYITM